MQTSLAATEAMCWDARVTRWRSSESPAVELPRGHSTGETNQRVGEALRSGVGLTTSHGNCPEGVGWNVTEPRLPAEGLPCCAGGPWLRGGVHRMLTATQEPSLLHRGCIPSCSRAFLGGKGPQGTAIFYVAFCVYG